MATKVTVTRIARAAGDRAAAGVGARARRGGSGPQAGRYHVTYERDQTAQGRIWVAEVREVPQAHTQGPTLAITRARIREALGLFIGAPAAAAAELVDVLPIPATVRRTIRAYHQARTSAAQAERRAGHLARAAVKGLQSEALGLSMRDAAALLGVSHQRVHQWVK